MSENKPRDPLDPRREPAGFDPLVPGAGPHSPLHEPGPVNYTDARRGGSAGLVLAAVFAVLLVIGFVAFTGEGVDPETTATIPGPATTDETAPPAADPQPMEPAPAQEAEPPAATPPPAAPAPAQ